MRWLAAMGVAVAFGSIEAVPAAAQGDGATCRALAPRGQIWVDCCRQSYARAASGQMGRKERDRQIARCVQNGGRL